MRPAVKVTALLALALAASPAAAQFQEAAAPVSVSVGSIAGDALVWAATAFGGVLSAAITALVVKWSKVAGIQITDAARARLQEIVVNGMHAGAKKAADELRGESPVTIRNAAVANAVAYVQEHGAETLKELGNDPGSHKATEAIKARIEAAAADPATPTPAVMDPAPVAAKPQPA